MKWNFTEFKTYLLLEAAHGDMVFTQDEQEIITNKINPDTYRKIYNEFMEDTDYQRIEKIRDAAKTYCDTVEKKQELIHNVKGLFESDGKFDQMEKNLMMFIKKIL